MVKFENEAETGLVMVMRHTSQPDPRDRVATEAGGQIASGFADRDPAIADFVTSTLETIDIAVQPAPGGVLTRQLGQPPLTQEVFDLARLVVLAADPCTPAIIRLSEAAHA